MRVKHHVRAVRRAIARKRLVFALVVACILAIAFTVVSISIYKLGGYYRYDLSRPGYEKERTEIVTTPSDVVYDTTSALTPAAIEAFLQQLDGHRTSLEQYNTYGTSGLGDEDLLIINQAVAPQ